MMIRLGQRSMALFTLMSLSGYLRPHEGLSLSKGSLIAPLGNVTRFWSLPLHYGQLLKTFKKVQEL